MRASARHISPCAYLACLCCFSAKRRSSSSSGSSLITSSSWSYMPNATACCSMTSTCTGHSHIATGRRGEAGVVRPGWGGCTAWHLHAKQSCGVGCLRDIHASTCGHTHVRYARQPALHEQPCAWWRCVLDEKQSESGISPEIRQRSRRLELQAAGPTAASTRSLCTGPCTGPCTGACTGPCASRLQHRPRVHNAGRNRHAASACFIVALLRLGDGLVAAHVVPVAREMYRRHKVLRLAVHVQLQHEVTVPAPWVNTVQRVSLTPPVADAQPPDSRSTQDTGITGVQL